MIKLIDVLITGLFRPRTLIRLIALIVVVLLVVFGIKLFSGTNVVDTITSEISQVLGLSEETDQSAPGTGAIAAGESLYSKLPAYSGSPYCIVNDNQPFFTNTELLDAKKLGSYEIYGDLDKLGRCTACIANIGYDLMPTDERESISSVKPTGWQSQAGENPAVYNRCHLIGFQLTAENANDKNLITGTRAMNVDAMLPFENMVADYIKEAHANGKDVHVLYRVTPYFAGDELVARGVLMEAFSIEEEDIRFCVWCYNDQKNIQINYLTGKYKHLD